MLPYWELVEADLADIGIDVYSGVLDQRPFRWLQKRVSGLLTKDSRLYRLTKVLAEESTDRGE